LLPTSRTFFDIRIIAFRVAAVIPVAGWVLLDGGRRLLDVNGWRYRYGDHGRRIIRVIKRVAVKGITVIGIKWRAERKPKTGITVACPIGTAIQAANHQ